MSLLLFVATPGLEVAVLLSKEPLGRMPTVLESLAQKMRELTAAEHTSWGKGTHGAPRRIHGLARAGKEHRCEVDTSSMGDGEGCGRGQGPVLHPVLDLWSPDAWTRVFCANRWL